MEKDSVLICCMEMLCDLTGVNDAFEFGFWWDDTDGKPLRLHEWLQDVVKITGDTPSREISHCPYCGRVPLKRRHQVANIPPLQHWVVGDKPKKAGST